MDISFKNTKSIKKRKGNTFQQKKKNSYTNLSLDNFKLNKDFMKVKYLYYVI